MRKDLLSLDTRIDNSYIKDEEDHVEVSKIENQPMAMRIDLVNNSKRNKTLLKEPYYALVLNADNVI